MACPVPASAPSGVYNVAVGGADLYGFAEVNVLPSTITSTVSTTPVTTSSTTQSSTTIAPVPTTTGQVFTLEGVVKSVKDNSVCLVVDDVVD